MLDDYADAFRALPCAARLAGHEVVAFTDSVSGAALVERLDGFDAVVLLQQRTAVPRDVVERLTTCGWSARPDATPATSTSPRSPSAASW